MKITKLCLCKSKTRPYFKNGKNYICADCGQVISDYEKQVLNISNIETKEDEKNVKKDHTDIYLTD